jgi:microcin C transport system substrate-binding protein
MKRMEQKRMRLSRRRVLQSGMAAGAAMSGFAPHLPTFAETSSGGWRGGGHRSHGESLIGALRYPADFPHFDYVNPNAPKGGRVRLSRRGRFDNFNPFIPKGQGAAEIGYLYESLMTPSADEGSTHYGLLAEWMEVPADSTWVAFRLRDAARWTDGRQITPEDVIYSLDLFKTKAAPFYRFYYQDVEKAIDEGDRIVRFRFSVSGNRELPHIMGQLYVLPKHWWASRDFESVLLEAPLGSGPYAIARYAEGRFIELERVNDYWGENLPVNIGQNNFDLMRFEYFQDLDIAFEAFRGGKIDFWNENSAKRWAQKYDFPGATSGDVTKSEPVLEGPKSIQYFAMNTRRAKFQDRRIREAIALAFDFQTSNRQVFFNQYAQPKSYFQGAKGLMAEGLPDEAELALLEPYRDQLPPDLFEKPFELPKTKGDGNNRRNLRKARRLLEAAGCTLKDGVLHTPAGDPFTIVFLTGQQSQKPVVDPFLANLRDVLGIQASLRVVDVTQYQGAVRSFEFDMIISGVRNSESPGNEQRDYWSSTTAQTEGARNVIGVRNPVVDHLIDKIIFAKNRTQLETASRALDRVLLWEHYAVLELYTPFARIAYWNKHVTPPDPLPSRAIEFPATWWSSEV